MWRKVFLVLCIVFLSSCSAQQPPSFRIQPLPCLIEVNNSVLLSIEGAYPSNSNITWTASVGTLISPSEASTEYVAPSVPGKVTIIVTIENDGVETSKPIECDVVEISDATDMTDTTDMTDASDTLPPQQIETPTMDNQIEGVETETPTLEATNPPNSGDDLQNIVISEIMADPCGGTDIYDPYNEYIELFNIGEADVDVYGLWITGSTSHVGSPDKIVSWSERNPDAFLGSTIITDSTIIPPKSFAIILSPKYYAGTGMFGMPYRFPDNTIILTVEKSDRLGGENGLISSGVSSSSPRDILVLYSGTDLVIDYVISTYGTPQFGQSPNNVVDDENDAIPFYTGDCKSVVRINLSGSDNESNWRVEDQSPGE